MGCVKYTPINSIFTFSIFTFSYMSCANVPKPLLLVAMELVFTSSHSEQRS